MLCDDAYDKQRGRVSQYGMADAVWRVTLVATYSRRSHSALFVFNLYVGGSSGVGVGLSPALILFSYYSVSLMLTLCYTVPRSLIYSGGMRRRLVLR